MLFCDISSESKNKQLKKFENQCFKLLFKAGRPAFALGGVQHLKAGQNTQQVGYQKNFKKYSVW